MFSRFFQDLPDTAYSSVAGKDKSLQSSIQNKKTPILK
jgi:hypothetical protein